MPYLKIDSKFAKYIEDQEQWNDSSIAMPTKMVLDHFYEMVKAPGARFVCGVGRW